MKEEVWRGRKSWRVENVECNAKELEFILFCYCKKGVMLCVKQMWGLHVG